MKFGSSMPHPQGPSNNPYPEPSQPNPSYIISILTMSSNPGLGLCRGLFPMSLPLNILKALLPSSILATCPDHLNVLDLITMTTFGERANTKQYHITNSMTDGTRIRYFSLK
jgi:hypothetical protein